MAKTKDAATAKERHNKALRFRRQALGFMFLCLAIIGACTIIYSAFHYINRAFFDDTEDKQNYQELIAPLVALDPAPFATIAEANQDFLLESAIWASLNYEDNAKYTRDEYDSIVLPTVDVERYYTKMYGPSHVLEHRSFFDLDIEFVYDSAKSAYIIPITSQGGSFTPFVEEIRTSGNTKILTVAYMQYSTSSVDIVTDSSTQTVAKRMDYVMRKEAKGFYIYSIKEFEAQAE